MVFVFLLVSFVEFFFPLLSSLCMVFPIAQGVPHCCAQAVLLSETTEDWTCRCIPPHTGIVHCQALKLNFVSSALPQAPIKGPV